MECQTCKGMRFTSRQERKKWYQSGTWCYLGNATQTVTELCTDCNGSGLAPDPAANPDCTWCHGTGEMTVSDGTGCVDTDVCVCKPANPVERAYIGAGEAF